MIFLGAARWSAPTLANVNVGMAMFLWDKSFQGFAQPIFVSLLVFAVGILLANIAF